MRRFAFWKPFLLPALLALGACASEPAQNHVTLKIAVADDFAPVMSELADSYHRHQPWIDLEIHKANTARLEKDLQDGVAYDIYLPDQVASMENLASKDAINPLSRQLLALNQLVVIAPADSDLALNFQELANANVRQIAVANPNVLLGHVTREALTSVRMLPNHDATPLGQPANATGSSPASLPSSLASLANAPVVDLEPKLLVAANADDILAAVTDGRAQVGITYASFAENNKKVRILGSLPYGSYEPVAYNVAVPRNAPHNDEAWQFLNYLRSAEAHAIMQRAGLLVN